MKTRTVQVIDVADWDSLVRETYRKPYHFQQQDGCKDRGHEYLTVPAEPLDYPQKTIPLILNHKIMGGIVSDMAGHRPSAT